jgi:dihydroxyacetone kinase DhaKLM complex PTS-EIIA-like component DhaM
MAGEKARVVGVGGNEEGGIGTSTGRIYEALLDLLGECDGIVVLPDLGSAVLSAKAALDFLEEEQKSKVLIADAPVLEGAVMAVVEASTGSSLEKVKQVAEEAHSLKKLRV